MQCVKSSSEHAHSILTARKLWSMNSPKYKTNLDEVQISFTSNSDGADLQQT